MKIRETRIATCAFSAAIEIAHEFFERADEPSLAPMGASSARRRRSCTLVADHTDRARYHHALHLSWCEHHALAPGTFEGLLSVRPASGRVEVVLEGEISDVVGTAALLDAIVAFVEREWAAFVARTPSIEACNARGDAGLALA